MSHRRHHVVAQRRDLTVRHEVDLMRTRSCLCRV
jgi:hypothetical protein